MCALPRHYLTPEEYLALERQAPTKSEYLRGEVFAMAGASFAHTTISLNLLVLLAPQLKQKPCTAAGVICGSRCLRLDSTPTRTSWSFVIGRSSRIASVILC